MKIGFVQCVARCLSVLLFLGLSAAAMAEGGGGESFKDGVNYLSIKPSLVVNYGGPGKVKYIKAEISLRVDSKTAAEEVTHHMPLVRDTLILLMSSVTDEQMSSGDGKEQMREQALAKLNEVLEKAVHPQGEAEPKKSSKSEQSKKDEKKDDKKDAKAEEEHKVALITDLLFDNLVVQR